MNLNRSGKRRVSYIQTESWQGSSNRHKPYHKLGKIHKSERDRMINKIEQHWPNVSRDTWIPPDVRPQDLPEDPQDWSNPTLHNMTLLAEAADGEIDRAHRFLRLAPTREGGKEGYAVGEHDIYVASEMCAEDEDGEAAEQEMGEEELDEEQAGQEEGMAESKQDGVDQSTQGGVEESEQEVVEVSEQRVVEETKEDGDGDGRKQRGDADASGEGVGFE